MVRLARGVREANRISHRQPLRSISVANLPADTIASHREILLEELNVKEVRRLETLDDYARPAVKLDYPRLGKRLRGEVSSIQNAINAGEYVLAGDRTTLQAAGHTLGEDDFSCRFVPLSEGTGIAAEGRLVVVVDLTIDEALQAERQVRDLNRGLQDLRKEAGLQYQDRIVVAILAPSFVLEAVASHRDWLAEEALAMAIQFEPLASPDARKEVSVGGVGGDTRAEIMLKKAVLTA